jgi:hypothetical protein
VRAHGGVENRLHWVLDVIFREDLARFRTGDALQNMAIIRHANLAMSGPVSTGLTRHEWIQYSIRFCDDLQHGR